MTTKKPTKLPREKTRGEKVIAFIETYCLVPEGALVGQPMVLDDFQMDFIKDVYDNKVGTKMGILSIARKNGKTGLIAGIVLAHVCGPEARLNSQLCSGAMSREQAALVFNLACKMVQLSPKLQKLVRIVPSSKRLIGLNKNVEYKALSAEGKTAHGLSPVLAILDEVGQVRGSQSDFIDAILTSQGAHTDAMVLVISTQAPNDADLLSIWIDDAMDKDNQDPKIVCHLHTAEADCDMMDEAQWRASNPAIGKFRSEEDMRAMAEKASRMPSFEPTFRNLHLNQRVEMVSPFISRGVWIANSGEIDESAFYEGPVYAGLDLSGKTDLTSLQAVAWKDNKFHVKSWFWTPEKGLRERAKRDRAPYDVWVKQGFIRTIPGAAIDYETVAVDIMEALDGMELAGLAFDRWRFDLLLKELKKLGFKVDEEDEQKPLIRFGQGFKDMAPALDRFEEILLNEQMLHGGNPVLTMCMANARIETDAADNRKLTKAKSTGRIDGAVALSMAVGVLPQELKKAKKSVYEGRGIRTV